MKVSGPLVTLGVVAALGAAILIVNVSQQSEPSSGKPVKPSQTTTAAQAPPAPAPPPAEAFPPKADYVGKIPSENGVITLEITVNGDKAVAYACDGKKVEVWLSGSAVDGHVDLYNKTKTSRVDGRLKGNTVVGTLSMNQKVSDFTANAVPPPAGLYVYNENGVRSSWIIDEDNDVTGVQRQPDGSTSPAPGLSLNGTTLINGRTVTVIRVDGDSHDF